jgi:hypothetical protein
MSRPKKESPSCHPDRAYFAKDLCKMCYDKNYNKEYYNNKKEGILKAKKILRKTKNSEEMKNNARKKHLWKIYRITPEDWEKISKFQGDVCAISGKPKKTKNLALDHDHKTGKIRGLLSMGINRGLSMFNDDPELLRKAADYLENPPATQALGKEIFGLIGKARYKKKMVYGPPPAAGRKEVEE